MLLFPSFLVHSPCSLPSPLSPPTTLLKKKKNKLLCSESDEYSLLDSPLVGLLNLLLGPSMHFLVKSSFSKEPVWVSSKNPSPYLWYLITLDTGLVSSTCISPKVTSNHLAYFPVRMVQPESPSPLMFPFNLLSANPHTAPGYKFPLAHVVFGTKPHFSHSLQDPITVLPVPITMLLGKV